MIELIIITIFLAVSFFLNRFLRKIRREDFDAYLDMHLSTLNTIANNEWILNGGIEKRYEIDREASHAKLEATWCWDYAFMDKVVIK